MKVTRDPRGEETVRARCVESVDYLCFVFFLLKFLKLLYTYSNLQWSGETPKKCWMGLQH